jgi:hypothetical protein
MSPSHPFKVFDRARGPYRGLQTVYNSLTRTIHRTLTYSAGTDSIKCGSSGGRLPLVIKSFVTLVPAATIPENEVILHFLC